MWARRLRRLRLERECRRAWSLTTSAIKTVCSMLRFVHWHGAWATRFARGLRQVSTPRARIQAIIDANLAPEEFEQRTGTAWLAFWGQVLQVQALKRVQSVYQRRTLSNLRSSLKQTGAARTRHSRWRP